MSAMVPLRNQIQPRVPMVMEQRGTFLLEHDLQPYLKRVMTEMTQEMTSTHALILHPELSKLSYGVPCRLDQGTES